MVWNEVIEALDSIIDDYERVNHLISFNQDDKVRMDGLEKVQPVDGVALELGAGPGNFSQMIDTNNLVCLDFSAKMHKTARKRNHKLGHHYVRGVFESLPFRTGSTGFITAAYALRDSLDKDASFNEVHRVLRSQGKFLLVDIGKPDHLLLQTGMSLHMFLLVPLIGAIAGGRRENNPWRVLYDTFKILPTNQSMQRMVSKIFGESKLNEYSLGGLVTLIATKI